MKKLNYIIVAAILLMLMMGCADASSKSNDWNQPHEAQETQIKRLHGMQSMTGIYEVTYCNTKYLVCVTLDGVAIERHVPASQDIERD
jgi:outer membrane lipoprotein SlyB